MAIRDFWALKSEQYFAYCGPDWHLPNDLIFYKGGSIELGKVFAARGLAVTILIVKLPHDTGATGPFLAGVTAANPSISFHQLPPVDVPAVRSRHPEAVTFEVARLSNSHLRDFLSASSPDVLMVDFFCSVAVDVAAELRVPAYFFFTSGAEVLAFFLYLPVLHAQSTASFRDMGEELVHVPGIDLYVVMR